MMLKQILDADLVAFESGFENWEQAVRASCRLLKKQGYIDERYEEAIVQNIHEHGAYIVLIPGVAMPHSTQGGAGVFQSGVAFMKSDEPVFFTEDAWAKLFFTLAAQGGDQHLENIKGLMDLLMKEGVVEALMAATTRSDLERISNEYNI